MWKANEYTKRCSTSCCILKSQRYTTVYDKNSHALMEEGTTEKNVENNLSVSYKFKHTLYDQPIPLIGIYSNEMKN